MDVFTRLTFGGRVINGVKAPLLEDAINQNRTKQQSKYNLIWGTINVGLLSLILYDIAYTCPLHISYIHYLEYVGMLILILNILYHFGRYLKLNWRRKATYMPVPLTPATPDASMNKMSLTPDLNATNISLSNTPMNMTALSWMSGSSPNESVNFPIKSESWLYARGSPNVPDVSPVKTPRQDTSGIAFISNEDSLHSYLKDYEANEKIANINNLVDTSSNILSSFWNHPITKTPKDTSFLKRSQYQLSSQGTGISSVYNQSNPITNPNLPNYYYGLFPPFADNLQKVISVIHSVTNKLVSPSASPASNSPKSDDKGSPRGSPAQSMDTWRRINVDIVTLTQWYSNLRLWLSQTILQRLVKEFDTVDDALVKQGLNDIQIGKVGLDRIRKTAQTAPVVQYIPSLATIVPFLELTANQEYLIQRIKELARGRCMSEFKWNGGGCFNGKEWDSSLPTDSAIIMHIFATYLDIQLLPLPNQPDVKPFSGYHFLKQNEKLPPLTDKTLLIQQCLEYPPHYRVIVGEEVHELPKGYNNLFQAILLFLYFVNKKELGMIGRVNCGKSGLNMLWIIES